MNKYIDTIAAYFNGQIPTVLGFCLKVILSILVFFIGRKIIKWLIKILRTAMQRGSVDLGIIQFTASLSKGALYVLLAFSIATNFGVTEASVAALLGTAGVTLGLALQGGLKNLAGGVMILLFKPFAVGDYIVVNSITGCEGTVSRIEMCYTTVATIENQLVIIPNGTLADSCITNKTAKSEQRIDVKISISYQADLKKAKSLIEELLRKDKDVLQDKELAVFVDRLGDSAIVLGFRAWVPTEVFFPTKWRLNEQIKELFDENGIEIPYKQLDVHIRNN